MLVTSSGFAASVSDIPSIQSGFNSLEHRAAQCSQFADALKSLQDNGFTYLVVGSTTPIALNNSNKQDLIATYNQCRADVTNIVGALP